MRPAQIECSASGSGLCDPIYPKRKITDFFEKENTMEQMVSRIIAKDGIALSTFCTSKDLRYLFSKAGHKLPASYHTVKSMVVKYAEMIRDKMKYEIQHQKSKEELKILLDI
ncbi:hypothetical protein WDU94_010781 [Cyamophila willieti]